MSEIDTKAGPAADEAPGEHEERARRDAASPRLNRTRSAYRGYYRWLRLSRLTLGGSLLMAAIFLLWVVPWLPSGLDTTDYTPKVAFTVYLLGGAAITGLLAFGFQELARRDRETLVVWSSVYDEATGLHNRTYLFDRLSLECERAQRSGTTFSVIALQIRIGDSSHQSRPLPQSALRQVGQVIDTLIHTSDAVAVLNNNELAVVAAGLGQEDRHAVQDRLREAIAQQLPQLLEEPAIADVKTGAGTYGVDGDNPSEIIQAARMAAILTTPRRAHAA